ncbi:MAG: hypothetical protein M1546_07995 [Chloroflexi bacterium]|nr:hypothetical protein [Chloroflexota bacterium]
MRNYSVVPSPWWQVGLTTLPGLTLLLGPVFAALELLNTELRLVLLAVLLLLSLSSVLPVVMQRSLFKIQI